MSSSELFKFLPFILPISGLIFQAGSQSEKLDDLFKRAYAQEIEQKNTRELLYEMNGKLCTIEQDVKHIQKVIDQKSL
jgi:hypothetical protein